MSKAMDDFRLKLGGREYVPIIVGGTVSYTHLTLPTILLV